MIERRVRGKEIEKKDKVSRVREEEGASKKTFEKASKMV